jgi:hypothetical protein
VNARAASAAEVEFPPVATITLLVANIGTSEATNRDAQYELGFSQIQSAL